MPFARHPRPSSYAAVADASPVPFWLDDPSRPEPLAPLSGDSTADLLVVGGGFSGLWTALQAKEADPARDVLLVEGGRIGWAASGRNGGFCEASITHGLDNGLARWPEEVDTLLRLGHENHAALEATLDRYGIDCSFERVGNVSIATSPHHLDGLDEYADAARQHGEDVVVLDAEQTRARIDSPMAIGGVLTSGGTAILNPARLAWGLRDACLRLGVRIHEGTRATGFGDSAGAGVRVTTESDAGPGSVDAARVALATNAFPPLLKRLRHYVVPVYDYVLMTEPLTDVQWKSVGWDGREGLSNMGNQFHYYRRTDDGRILFGGYDAIYQRQVSARHDQRVESFALLAEHLRQVLPQLEDVGFSHRWGGAIDTCSRFSAFFGTAREGKVAYAAGYTGLGVGATRFGAAVMLDLLDGRDTERTRTRMVSTMPLPFPPEPVRGLGIALTTRSLAAADRTGRRNLWLRTLDRLGLGFDS
ncbi:MAG TPA: FAD-dependent oxidoreductase [Candidatus Nanopelagicales bacterium]|nr:FAD-dependent oxidoreductase [Candidatus Nanopelagicales bacterium]